MSHMPRPSNHPNRVALRSVGALVAVGALTFGLVACSSDSDDPDVQSAVSMRSEDATSSSGASGAAQKSDGSTAATLESDPAPEGDYSMSAAEAAPADGSYLGIRDVRIGSHDGFDRIVIEFMGDGAPGYWVRYEDMPTQQGSGNPLSVNGDHKLSIDVRGTGYPFDFNVEDYPSGPVRPADTTAVSEVRGFGTFEGTTQYLAGIDGERRPFKVFKASNPTRLIIDIQTS
ncbi:hypothetical protein [uncultured Corynebacterium sp.]|uniref:AMIN-like domain-containing (lipo)protein n=1 Tax=uncultured Corynebacterium sp. TaxID=159447 RepID=UPI0025F0EFD2|nr:hypothetical protein [uncultured Corynebacterium sp.]